MKPATKSAPARAGVGQKAKSAEKFEFTNFFAPYVRDVIGVSSDGSLPEHLGKSVGAKGFPRPDGTKA